MIVNKKILSGFLAACLLSGTMAMPAHAEDFKGESGWRVEFTPGNTMDSNFTSAEMAEAVAGLQPGDSITFQVGLENKNSASTEWYISNEILYSLEDRSRNGATSGGAYEYGLWYVDNGGDRHVLFSSDTVGGENSDVLGEGLHGATNAMEDYFYLDTLEKDDGGRIELRVGLDGETQGNDYQDTLADLKLNFAVTAAPKTTTNQPRPTPEPGSPDEDILDDPVPKEPWIVKTGDYRDFTGPAFLMAAGGAGMLLLVVLSILERRRACKASRGGGRI